ncbi:MAG: three-Cys-motif partner protein TcmP [Dehalococcoidia bacterium]|nr:three-Cys-motif partner protein TcmP [Dehalococcoidia bacterium]
MTQHPSFGGPWTQEKLDILRSYLNSYTTALKNQPFSLIYIDAFAGSGWYQAKQPEDPGNYGEFDELRAGSATIALEIDDRPFDHLIFVEKDVEFIESLSGLQAEHPSRNIEVIRGDANEELPLICQDMRSSERAVVFLDPYATEVDWATVESVANTKKIDCWILFPLSALTRMMDNDRRPNEELAGHLDRVFGGRQYWQEQLYRPSIQQSLFADEEIVAREPQNRIAALYKERLATIFHAVAPTSRQLRNSQNSPMFELMFAASNPAGSRIAIEIANHILERW